MNNLSRKINNLRTLVNQEGTPLTETIDHKGQRIFLAKNAIHSKITPRKPGHDKNILKRVIKTEVERKNTELTTEKNQILHNNDKNLVWTPKNYGKYKNFRGQNKNNELIWSPQEYREYRQKNKDELIFSTREYIASLKK